MPSDELLKMSLMTAVPLWIEQFKHLSWTEIQEIGKEASQVIAEKGDIIMFKGPKKGDTAKAFNALARGIAALSFVPGGVTIFGMHWETKLEGPEMGAAETFRFHYGPMELAINLQEAQNGLRKSFVLVKAGRDKKFTTMNMIPLTGNDDQDARRSAETTMWDLCEAYFEPEAARFSISMADVDAETRQAMSWEVERYINNSQQFIGFIDEACRTLQTTSN